MATKCNLNRFIKLLFYIESVFCLAISNEGYSQDDADNIELLFESKYQAWVQYYTNTPSSNPGSGEFDFELHFDNEPFRELVELGVSAVPFMIEKQQENHILGYALYLITKFKWTTTRHGPEPGEWYWVVEEFPDIWGDTGPPDSRVVWLRWWYAGQSYTDQRCSKLYNEWKVLQQTNQDELAAETYQWMMNLGIAILPNLMQWIDQGDIALISAVSVLTDGTVPADASAADVHDWWQANQSQWLIPFASTPPPSPYGGGSGEPNDPYLIHTAEQLDALGTTSTDWDKHFKLMADIDLSGFAPNKFHTIGNNYRSFNGHFDGNGHEIWNFTYQAENRDFLGLFGKVGFPAAQEKPRIIVQDLGLVDPNVDAGSGDRVGALIGYFQNAVFKDCYVRGGRVCGSSRIGGLIGSTINRTNQLSYSPWLGIIDCYASTQVEGAEKVGGLIGFFEGHDHPQAVPQQRAWMSRCYAQGTVSGLEAVGGLLGSGSRLQITDCYAQAEVVGEDQIGGLVGQTLSSEIMRCYSSGIVIGNDSVGGLLGNSNDAPIKDSFWDIETSGQTTSAGGKGRTTAEMKKKETFKGWDFDEIWDIVENETYPFLQSEFDNCRSDAIGKPKDHDSGE